MTFCLACSGGDETKPDSGSIDPIDTGTIDTGTIDAGTEEDSGITDTGVVEMYPFGQRRC
jgi:hypothetical protein